MALKALIPKQNFAPTRNVHKYPQEYDVKWIGIVMHKNY